MHRVIDAALDLQQTLREAGFAFCFIGGLAVQRWGEPRLTKDADATVLTAFTEDERLVKTLLDHYRPRRPDAGEFALRARVLLIEASNGTGLDIALGALDFERRCIERASPWNIDPAARLITCSAEDLLVHKAFAGREIDWVDIDGILVRQGAALCLRQVFEELEPLLELKQSPENLARLKAMTEGERGQKRPSLAQGS